MAAACVLVPYVYPLYGIGRIKSSVSLYEWSCVAAAVCICRMCIHYMILEESKAVCHIINGHAWQLLCVNAIHLLYIFIYLVYMVSKHVKSNMYKAASLMVVCGKLHQCLPYTFTIHGFGRTV